MRLTSAADVSALHGLEALVDERAEALVRRVAQHALEVHDAEEAAGGRLVRRQGDAHRGAERGRQVVASDERESLGDGRVGRHDDRLGGHETAGRVGAVREQEPHVVGLFGLHELEQVLAALLGQLRDEVGGVVGLHVVEHVGGAVVAEPREDVDLLGLGHLLEHVGEPVVGQLLGDLLPPLRGQVEQGVREVGGLQLGVGGDELLGRLRLARSASASRTSRHVT